jgi:prepilin-type N-terminal cleavage/methylation domain-containing protein
MLKKDYSRGFTLTELLVVLGILVALFGLLLPAVQRVREAANKVTCASQLRQLGLALQMHHHDHGVLPSNGGWDGRQQIVARSGAAVRVTTLDYSSGIRWHWGVGDPLRPPHDQTGSWAYAILPYVEQAALYRERNWEVPLKLLICPSRRSPVAQVPVNDDYGEYEGGGWRWGKTDYAANGWVIANRPHCRPLADLRDGTSNTVLVGEKALSIRSLETPTWYWDEPFFVGGSGGTQRVRFRVLRDSDALYPLFRGNWGSSHLAGAQFLFGDGSVRPLSYTAARPTVEALLTPNGGESVTVSE